MAYNPARLLSGIILTVCLTIPVSCATHYELARKHFDKGNHYYQHHRPARSLVEYSAAMDKLSLIPGNQRGQFLRAAILHHLYSIDALNVWNNTDESVHSRCPALAEIINSRNTSGDFLEQAFEQVKTISPETSQPDITRLSQWFPVKRDEICGDFFSRRAAEGPSRQGKSGENPGYFSGETEEPDRISEINQEQSVLFDKLRRYALYRIAKNFYLSAWLKISSLSMNESSGKTGAGGAGFETESPDSGLKENCRKKLQNIYWTLYAVSSSLPPGRKRTQEFTLLFKNESRQFLEMMKNMETAGEPGKFDAGRLPEDVLEEIFLRLDADFHMNEGRSKMTGAVEEVLRNKKDKAVLYLMDVLKHFILAQELSDLSETHSVLLEHSLNDTYFQLERLTRQEE